MDDEEEEEEGVKVCKGKTSSDAKTAINGEKMKKDALFSTKVNPFGTFNDKNSASSSSSSSAFSSGGETASTTTTNIFAAALKEQTEAKRGGSTASSPPASDASKPASASFVFGQNLQSRVAPGAVTQVLITCLKLFD